MIKLKEILDNIIDEVKKGSKKKGLYYYINRNQEQGKKPAKKGSKAYNKAVAAMKKINKNK